LEKRGTNKPQATDKLSRFTANRERRRLGSRRILIFQAYGIALYRTKPPSSTEYYDDSTYTENIFAGPLVYCGLRSYMRAVFE
jgi:hypothetical protein